MKIYKLDIDASKPIRKVVQMQQNSEGVLSVHVSNDGKYIRNLSCAVYDGGEEISALSEGGDSFGYKLAVGETPHIVKITAKSTPITCSKEYVASQSGSNRTRQVKLNVVQIPAGIYNQDEFYNLANYFGGSTLPQFLPVSSDCLSNTNFDTIVVRPWLKDRPVWFQSASTTLDTSTAISATGDVYLYTNFTIGKSSYTLSSETYPAIGYWTDYSLENVIRPSENAHCYAEQEVSDPTPDPEPEPDPEPTPDPDPDPDPTPDQGD